LFQREARQRCDNRKEQLKTKRDDALPSGATREIENTGGRTRRTGTGSSAGARKSFVPPRPFSGTCAPNYYRIEDSVSLP
jgi:hypothetical protein